MRRRAARVLGLLLALAAAPAAAELPVEPAQVLRVLPHDSQAFTEGLLIRDGMLYESTGREGRSVIRRSDLETGRVTLSVSVPPGLFGEGIVDWKDRLYSFVWRGGKGFVWNLKDFAPKGTWRYPGEGWAMTQDGSHIILSDGTAQLRVLQPGTMKELRRITVTAEGKPVPMLNELEYVNGEILANVWQTARIARIDPASGRVKGWIDLTALWRQVGYINDDAVPNGIAFDHASGKLYVTGKNWPALFEIAPPKR